MMLRYLVVLMLVVLVEVRMIAVSGDAAHVRHL